MKQTRHSFSVFPMLLCGLMLSAPVAAKDWLFRAPLFGPETDPTEPAYNKGSGGTVEVYKDATGTIYLELVFQTHAEFGVDQQAIMYDFSMEWGGCGIEKCYAPNVWFDIGPPAVTYYYMRDSTLIDQFVVDGFGKFTKEYKLADCLPPHVMAVETVGFRIQPSPEHNQGQLPTPFATGFKVRNPQSP